MGIGPADWWARQTQYSQSTAVASMAGWLVGLGDRHLDNILLDKSSGAVIHIDYNVCLERGKHLKVQHIPTSESAGIAAFVCVLCC